MKRTSVTRTKQPGVTEAGFQRTVIEYAHLFDWKVAHFRPARTKDGSWVTPVSADGKGFLDLFLVRRRTRQRLALELKVGSNKLTPEQEDWLAAMNECGIPAFVWWPRDWPEIEIVLRDGIHHG